MRVDTDSERDQERLGARLAMSGADDMVIFLQGDLGAGKTTLVRGFLRGLGYRGLVKSPTYTLLEPYQIDDRRCYHCDLYRLSDPEELDYLGIRDLLGGGATLLVEWPERGEGGLPPPDLIIRIDYASRGRTVSLESRSSLGHALLRRLEGR